MNFDYLISKKLTDFIKKRNFLKLLSLFFSDYLIFLIFIIIFFTYYFFIREKLFLISLKLGLTAISVYLIVLILRKLIKRLRPYAKDSSIEKLSNFGSGPRGASFPSSHTAIAFSLGLIVLTDWPIFAIFILFLAFLVALGRIFTGVHYLTDILGGIFLAAGVFLIVERFIF